MYMGDNIYLFIYSNAEAAARYTQTLAHSALGVREWKRKQARYSLLTLRLKHLNKTHLAADVARPPAAG